MAINLRPCIPGEVFFTTDLYESCMACPEKEYSFEDPNINNLTSC